MFYNLSGTDSSVQLTFVGVKISRKLSRDPNLDVYLTTSEKVF